MFFFCLPCFGILFNPHFIVAIYTLSEKNQRGGGKKTSQRGKKRLKRFPFSEKSMELFLLFCL